MAKYLHTNFNVCNLEKSLAFYEKALGLREVRRVEEPNGAFVIVFLGDGSTDSLLELTWLRDHPQPYDLGEGEFHIAYRVEDKKKPIPSMKKWAVSVLKTKRWISIL